MLFRFPPLRSLSILVVATAFHYTLSVAAPAKAAPAKSKAAGTPVKLTRGPYLQSITTTSAVIVWNTDRSSSSKVQLAVGADSQKWMKPVLKTAQLRRHIVKLFGLKPDTVYRYRIASQGWPLATATLQTTKAKGQPFSFAVWGDSGVGGRGQRELATRIASVKPDFMLHTGDLVYNRGEQHNYDPHFFKIYKPLLARAPFYGTLGNHDLGTANGQPFLDNFVLPRNGPAGITPERNYSFDYADAHFVGLDSNASEATLKNRIAPWLAADLRRSKARWKIVYFHHPPYTSGPHGDAKKIQRTLVPVFQRDGVDVVLNGHDHHYERFKPMDGVTYIVTGAGGAGRYPRRRTRAITARYHNSDWSFTHIVIRGNVLSGRQIARNGRIIDKWSLKK